MKSVEYYDAKSEISLEDACEEMKTSLRISDFNFGSHDTWRYAFGKNEDYELNVTETDWFDTIRTWMDNAPGNVNVRGALSMEPRDLAA